MRDILYPYGLDHSGKVVEAERADRNGWFTCIGCGERVILKRGEIKVAHFAHWREVEGCGGETVLHKMAKAGIKYGIERAIEEKRPYGFSWMCPVCGMEHWGNLAVNKRQIRVEAELEGMRPDLLAVSEKGKALVAIEVIVSHSPEPEAVETYKRIRVPVVLVPVGWDGLRGLSRELGRREVLNAACRARRCRKCKGIVGEIEVSSAEAYHCWRCRKLIRVLWPGGCEPYPEGSRSKSMIEPTSMVGVRMRWAWSRYHKKWYAMHVCRYCRAVQSDVYIYEYDLNPVMESDLKPDRSIEFYYCEACDIWEKKERVAGELATPKIINPPAKGGMTDGQ